MKSAIAFHVEGLRAEGMAVPAPSSSSSVRRDPGLDRDAGNRIRPPAWTGSSDRGAISAVYNASPQRSQRPPSLSS